MKCPEGQTLVKGHKRMGVYIRPHCRKENHTKEYVTEFSKYMIKGGE